MSEPEQVEDVLERFTDPEKKRKRKAKKEKKVVEKRAKVVESDKVLATSVFNSAPTPDELEIWEGFVDKPLMRADDLDALLSSAESMTTETIGYVRTDTKGLGCVLDFLSAALHCTEWLTAKLARIGWKSNMTGYSPIAVSHSTEELLVSTLEAYKMAVKQMRLFVLAQQ